MRILLVNHYAGSLQHGMEYRPFYLARQWLKLGHEVTIIAASQSHVRYINPEVKTKLTEQCIDGVPYLWIKTPAYGGNGIKRLINIFSFVMQLNAKARYLAKRYKPDVVIASSTYPYDTYPCGKIARLCGARLIHEVHDLWPLSPMVIGGYSKWHPFIWTMQKAENRAYKRSWRVVSILPDALPYMQAHGLCPERFVHVPNGIVLEDWQQGGTEIPAEHAAYFAENKANGVFTVGYCGGLAPSYALENLLETAQLMLKEPQFRFVIVGQGIIRDQLIENTRRMGLSNLTFLPAVPKTAVPALLGHIDLMYLGVIPGEITKYGMSQNKSFDYMMAARPIINATGFSNDPVTRSGCGISVPSRKPEELAEAIRKIAALSLAERESMGIKGREYVIAHHEYGVLAKSFLDAIE